MRTAHPPVQQNTRMGNCRCCKLLMKLEIRLVSIKRHSRVFKRVSSDFQLLHGFTHSLALVASDGQVVQTFVQPVKTNVIICYNICIVSDAWTRRRTLSRASGWAPATWMRRPSSTPLPSTLTSAPGSARSLTTVSFGKLAGMDHCVICSPETIGR